MDTKNSNGNSHLLEVERKFISNKQAMLAALCVVLDLARKPVVFKDEELNAHE